MTLTCSEAGVRLDVFLATHTEGLSRSAVQKLLDDGCVVCGGKVQKKNAKTTAGAVYELTLPPVREVAIEAEDLPLDIVYEDADVLVINKPKGIVVHPAPGHHGGTLVNALLYHCRDSLSGINGELRPGIVHRIDKDTSGLLIVAKNDFAHQSLAAQLKDHTLCRTYEAIVCGTLRDDCGTVDAPIGRHPTDRKKMAVTDKNSRHAVTHYEVLARYAGYTHVRCHLETGRTHQIRVHMAYVGHPILGDAVYGHKSKELWQLTQCLHARELTFLHPRSGEPVTVSCPLPEYFTALLNRLQQR